MATISKAELVEFLNFINPENIVTVADINDAIFNGNDQFLLDKTGASWDSSSRTLYLNGEGTRVIYIPFVPVTSISEIKIVAKDETETTIVLDGTSREVWWDRETGRVEIIKFLDDFDSTVMNALSKFPKGMENVHITGVFAANVPSNAKLVCMLLYLKWLTMFDKENYNMDLIMQRIGRYEYRVGVPSNQAQKNQYKGLDAMIEWHLDMLNQDFRVFDV